MSYSIKQYEDYAYRLRYDLSILQLILPFNFRDLVRRMSRKFISPTFGVGRDYRGGNNDGGGGNCIRRKMR